LRVRKAPLRTLGQQTRIATAALDRRLNDNGDAGDRMFGTNQPPRGSRAGRAQVRVAAGEGRA
jgi:hypothetical protein